MSCKFVQRIPDTYVHYRNTLTECSHAVCAIISCESAASYVHQQKVMLFLVTGPFMYYD